MEEPRKPAGLFHLVELQELKRPPVDRTNGSISTGGQPSLRGGGGWLVALPATAQPVSLQQDLLDVRGDLVELGEGDDHLAGVAVLDLQHDEISGTLDAFDFIGERVELDRFGQLGVLAHDDSDEIFVAALRATDVGNSN